LHSGVLDIAVTKIANFIVDFLREFEAIFKKAIRGPEELFDGKTEVKNLVSGSL
jgi:hypothetical protein